MHFLQTEKKTGESKEFHFSNLKSRLTPNLINLTIFSFSEDHSYHSHNANWQSTSCEPITSETTEYYILSAFDTSIFQSKTKKIRNFI